MFLFSVYFWFSSSVVSVILHISEPRKRRRCELRGLESGGTDAAAGIVMFNEDTIC